MGASLTVSKILLAAAIGIGASAQAASDIADLIEDGMLLGKDPYGCTTPSQKRAKVKHPACKPPLGIVIPFQASAPDFKAPKKPEKAGVDIINPKEITVYPAKTVLGQNIDATYSSRVIAVLKDSAEARIAKEPNTEIVRAMRKDTGQGFDLYSETKVCWKNSFIDKCQIVRAPIPDLAKEGPKL